MNLTSFRINFPEFSGVGDALVQAKLDEAALSIDASIWNTKKDAGQGYLAAHKLALSPYGQQARMVAKDGTTTYEKHYERLQREVTCPVIVP